MPNPAFSAIAAAEAIDCVNHVTAKFDCHANNYEYYPVSGSMK